MSFSCAAVSCLARIHSGSLHPCDSGATAASRSPDESGGFSTKPPCNAGRCFLSWDLADPREPETLTALGGSCRRAAEPILAGLDWGNKMIGTDERQAGMHAGRQVYVG